MKYQQFGNTELKVSSLGLGAALINSRTTGPDESKVTLNKAFELGINFYDTAPSYGQGNSEELIGEVFQKKREQVIITTKFGNSPTAVLKAASKFKPLFRKLMWRVPIIRSNVRKFVNFQTKIDFEPSSMVKSVEDSLRRLRSDYIDLLLLHSPSREIIVRGNVFEQLQSLKQQGKIRYYGVSTDLENALLLLKNPELEISALQIVLNLFEQEAIDEVIPLAKKRGIAIVARKPFANGKLIPKNADSDTKGLRNVGSCEADERFDFLTQDGAHNITQAALKFALQTEGVSVVLAGMSKVKHVQENVSTFAASPLTVPEMEKIRSMSTTLAS